MWLFSPTVEIVSNSVKSKCPKVRQATRLLLWVHINSKIIWFEKERCCSLKEKEVLNPLPKDLCRKLGRNGFERLLSWLAISSCDRESGERETVKEKERKMGLVRVEEGGKPETMVLSHWQTRDNMLQAPGQTVHESQIVLEVNKRIKKERLWGNRI